MEARVCKLTTIKTLSQLPAFLKNNFPDALFSEKLSRSFFSEFPVQVLKDYTTRFFWQTLAKHIMINERRSHTGDLQSIKRLENLKEKPMLESCFSTALGVCYLSWLKWDNPPSIFFRKYSHFSRDSNLVKHFWTTTSESFSFVL